jgi:hypothetical protein
LLLLVLFSFLFGASPGFCLNSDISSPFKLLRLKMRKIFYL